MCNLLEKYRPRSLGELLGQPWASHQLQLFAQQPYSAAFLFEGDTGTGKTSAALLLAEALGVQIEQGPFGGLHQIASGEQTGETVRRMMESLRCRPFFGSGWKVLVVNEADAMTPNAAFVWLDALEDLPPQTVIIFTTNAAGRIPARLRDRCERLAFESSALLLRPYLQELTDRSRKEGGGPYADRSATRRGHPLLLCWLGRLCCRETSGWCLAQAARLYGSPRSLRSRRTKRRRGWPTGRTPWSRLWPLQGWRGLAAAIPGSSRLPWTCPGSCASGR